MVLVVTMYFNWLDDDLEPQQVVKLALEKVSVLILCVLPFHNDY